MKKLIIVSLLAAFMSGCALYIPRPVPVVTYSYAEPAVMVVPTYRERRVIYRSPPPRVINNHYYRCKVSHKRNKKYCR